MKEIWYGFNNEGSVVETFYGTYGEAVDYYNSDKCNALVVRFDTKNTCEELETYVNGIVPLLESIE